MTTVQQGEVSGSPRSMSHRVLQHQTANRGQKPLPWRKSVRKPCRASSVLSCSSFQFLLGHKTTAYAGERGIWSCPLCVPLPWQPSLVLLPIAAVRLLSPDCHGASSALSHQSPLPPWSPCSSCFIHFAQKRTVFPVPSMTGPHAFFFSSGGTAETTSGGKIQLSSALTTTLRGWRHQPWYRRLLVTHPRREVGPGS